LQLPAGEGLPYESIQVQKPLRMAWPIIPATIVEPIQDTPHVELVLPIPNHLLQYGLDKYASSYFKSLHMDGLFNDATGFCWVTDEINTTTTPYIANLVKNIAECGSGYFLEANQYFGDENNHLYSKVLGYDSKTSYHGSYKMAKPINKSSVENFCIFLSRFIIYLLKDI
jgi:hypothetical protein